MDDRYERWVRLAYLLAGVLNGFAICLLAIEQGWKPF